MDKKLNIKLDFDLDKLVAVQKSTDMRIGRLRSLLCRPDIKDETRAKLIKSLEIHSSIMKDIEQQLKQKGVK